MNVGSNGIPARELPLSARAPGKCIVFGEHAVVHGAPELVFAIDLSTQVFVKKSETNRLNADSEGTRRNDYFRSALELAWKDHSPVDVRAISRIPKAAGLGSSAAFVASLAAVLSSASGGIDRPRLAQQSFEIERAAQGVGSPGDTSTAVAGGFVAINGGSGELLWSIRAPERQWDVRRVSDPGWVWVVAYSGIPRSTAEAVRAVGARLGAPGGPELLEEFRRVAKHGIDALGRGDRSSVAELLKKNQELLREVGVSHPRLEALLEAAAPASEGAKLTGAGAGGSVVALPVPGKEAELVRRLARAGGLPFVVRPVPDGASLVEG
ncbi:MAG: mevalonate kinase [Thermoplasmata archaeon]|nr:mevalonate kinase [Thermoplasmata archaeon]